MGSRVHRQPHDSGDATTAPTGLTLLPRAQDRRIAWHRFVPGKVWQNGYNERCHRESGLEGALPDAAWRRSLALFQECDVSEEVVEYGSGSTFTFT